MLAFSGAVLQKVWGQGARYVIAEMRVGKIRGIESRGIKIFKEILYGANTERGGQQVYATIGPGAVDGGRDALAYVHSAPQTAPASGSPVLLETRRMWHRKKIFQPWFCRLRRSDMPDIVHALNGFVQTLFNLAVIRTGY